MTGYEYTVLRLLMNRYINIPSDDWVCVYSITPVEVLIMHDSAIPGMNDVTVGSS